MITDAQWDNYKSIINSAHDFFNQDSITWIRKSHGLQRWGEDDASIRKDDTITLKCLINYNIYRSWPITKESEAGTVDKESMMVILNINYLRGLGYINANGNFDFNPSEDYFIHQGQKLRSAGETPAAQAKDEPLFIFLILKQMETNTGSSKY